MERARRSLARHPLRGGDSLPRSDRKSRRGSFQLGKTSEIEAVEGPGQRRTRMRRLSNSSDNSVQHHCRPLSRRRGRAPAEPLEPTAVAADDPAGPRRRTSGRGDRPRWPGRTSPSRKRRSGFAFFSSYHVSESVPASSSSARSSPATTPLHANTRQAVGGHIGSGTVPQLGDFPNTFKWLISCYACGSK